MVRVKMHGQLLPKMPGTIDKVKIWKWTRKVDTEALIFAAQEVTGTGNKLC